MTKMNEVNYIVVDGLKVGVNSIRYWREQIDLLKKRVSGLRGHLAMISSGGTENAKDYAKISLDLDMNWSNKNGVDPS